MKPPLSSILLFAAALILLVAPTARAGGGLNLGWYECGGFGPLQRNFACNTNSYFPLRRIIGSAISPVPIPGIVSMAATLELQTNQAALTPWWNFDPPGCRSGPPGALFCFFDFTIGPFTCNDIWGGSATGSISYVSSFDGPNRGLIRLVCAVPVPVAADKVTENYYFGIDISSAKSTGPGACAGCTDGACIVFTQLELDQGPGLGNIFITSPLLRQYVLYNGSATEPICQQAVPTRPTTWGTVKSLYR